MVASNNNNMITKTRRGREMLTPFIPKKLIARDNPDPSRGDAVCCFCGVCPEYIYLFTKRQIYACEHCSDIVKELTGVEF